MADVCDCEECDLRNECEDTEPEWEQADYNEWLTHLAKSDPDLEPPF